MGIGIGNRVDWGRVTMTSTPANKAFEFTVDTTRGDGLSQFTIRTKPSPNYNIETSDGQVITGVTSQSTTITFPSSGIYTVKLTNYIPGFELVNTGASNAAKLIEISNWGKFCADYSGSLYGAFYGCGALQITATDIPDFSGITSFQQAFINCSLSSGIPNVKKWSVSNATNLTQMFRNTQLTSIDVSGWDLPALTSMSYMFEDCDELISVNLSNWNAPLLTDMSYVFQQSLLLQTIDLTNFYAPSLTNLTYTFYNAPNLSNIIDINNLDVSNVTSMQSTFQTTKFNQP